MCKRCELGNHQECTGRVHSGVDAPSCQCKCEFAPGRDPQAAKDLLERQIMEYWRTVEPDTFIGDWVLVVHKSNIKTERDQTDIISTLVPTTQPAYRTSGLLEHGSSTIMDQTFYVDDDE